MSAADAAPPPRFDLGTRGYEIVSLLSPRQVHDLRVAYERFEGAPPSGFQATMYSTDREHRRAVFECIASAIGDAVRARGLTGYLIAVANWLVKALADPASEVAFHQDWSFVDEARVRSINLWMPLTDVDEENGCLEVVAGSHLCATDFRAHSDPCRFADLLPEIRRDLVRPVPMRAGQALLYDGALLHGSAPNRSLQTRVAIGVVLAPTDATLVHAFRTAPDTIDLFAVDREFFWRHAPGTPPSGVASSGTFASSTRQHGAETLARLRASVKDGH